MGKVGQWVGGHFCLKTRPGPQNSQTRGLCHSDSSCWFVSFLEPFLHPGFHLSLWFLARWHSHLSQGKVFRRAFWILFLPSVNRALNLSKDFSRTPTSPFPQLLLGEGVGMRGSSCWHPWLQLASHQHSDSGGPCPLRLFPPALRLALSHHVCIF